MPAALFLGDQFDVAYDVFDIATYHVVATGVAVSTLYGNFSNCVQLQYQDLSGREDDYIAPGYGVVKIAYSGANNAVFSLASLSGHTVPAFTYGLSGYLLLGATNGPAMTNVSVSLSGPGGSRSGSVGTNGQFSFTGLAAGSYTITPVLTGYSFSPALQSLTLNADLLAAKFVGTPIITDTSTANNLTLTWPDTATGYRVVSALSLPQPITWSNVTVSFVTNGGNISTVLPMTGPQKFYRLTKP